MGKLSTHVLNTAEGKPAAGMKIELSIQQGNTWQQICEVKTDADGRTDAPLLQGDTMRAGTFRLLFHVGEYFASRSSASAGSFLSLVPIEFIVSDPSQNYHVPLLVAPYGYSTYRGS